MGPCLQKVGQRETIFLGGMILDRRRLTAALSSVALIAALLLALVPAPALAAQQTAEPAVLTLGWWWKDARTEERDINGNKVVIDTPSPFCPSVPGQLGSIPGACAEGRFPVEIRGGEYEEPNMLSGIGFDLSYLTPGSTVTKFTMTLLEAEAGCYTRDGEPTTQPNPEQGDHCESTNPIGPVDERQVQACLIPEIFGDAEARPYNEVPRYLCSGSDPIAERKEIKAVDKSDADGMDHIWTFDLTSYAQQWAETFTVATSIMLIGKQPKETGGDDTWRVVFAGPRVEKGIQTELVYEPGEIVLPPPPPGTTTAPVGSTGTTDFGGGTGATDFGAGAPVDTGAAPETAPSPGASPGLEELAAELPEPESMPAYVWLGVIAGLIGFSLFRQVVVESTSGIRPDGVLSKIHALNAERRGLDAAAVEGPSALSGFAAVGRSIAHGISSLTSKLPFRGRG
jgi:hypothetical protein